MAQNAFAGPGHLLWTVNASATASADDFVFNPRDPADAHALVMMQLRYRFEGTSLASTNRSDVSVNASTRVQGATF